MNKQQILTAAIKKAKENGYVENEDDGVIFDMSPFSYYNENGCFVEIFSHRFAKKFFGEGEISAIRICEKKHDDTLYYGAICMAKWEFCLMEMVLKPDPTEYLKQFLDE